MKIIKYALQTAMVVSIASGVNSWAADNVPVAPATTTDGVKPDALVAILSRVPNAVLPAKAAQLVAQADFIHQAEVTADVVRTALDVNPGSATTLVETISRAVPAMAADAALAAVTRFPGKAPAIAAAATKGAPAMAGEIVKVLCRAQPYSYRAIAEAAAQVAPGGTRDILAAVAAAFPTMKATIAQVEAMHEGGTLSVYEVLAEIGDYVQVSSVSVQDSGVRGIRSLAPPPPPVNPPPTVYTSSGVVVPAGTRHDAVLP